MPIGQAKFGLLGGVVDPGKLELIERQEQLKIDKQLITIQEAKNEQTTER